MIQNTPQMTVPAAMAPATRAETPLWKRERVWTGFAGTIGPESASTPNLDFFRRIEHTLAESVAGASDLLWGLNLATFRKIP